MPRYKKKVVKKTRKAMDSFRKNFTTAGEAISTGYAVAKLAKKAWLGVKTIKKLINVEQNYLDVTASVPNTSFTNAGYWGCLNLCATGDGIGQRTGNSIRTQHLEINVDIVGCAAATPNGIRCIILRDCENDGALPATTDILATADTRAPYNAVIALKRFTVLYDKFMFLNPNLSTGLYSTRINYDAACVNHCLYDNTSAAQTSTKEGALFILLLSDTASGATSPTATIYSRLTYTDN